MQTLHVSTKEGQVGVWRDAGDRVRGRVAADCSVMGPRRRGEEETLATRRRATAAHRPLARNTPPPSAETSRSRHHSEAALTLQIYNYGFSDVQFCV